MGKTDERPIASMVTSEPTLPHLRARSTIHVDLLRPVRSNRRRTYGHPGGPPPAAVGRKRRKQRKELCASEDSSHNYFEGPRNNTRASCLRRKGKLPSQCPAIHAGLSRDLCGRPQGTKRHNPEVPSLRRSRSSSSTRHIKPDSVPSFTRSRDSQHHMPGSVASDPRWRAARTTEKSEVYRNGDTRKIVHNKRAPGVHAHVGAGQSPGLSSVAGRGKSREGLLRFRPATRQNLSRQDRRVKVNQGFQNQQEINFRSDFQKTLKSFGGRTGVEPNNSLIVFDVNLARPSPVYIREENDEKITGDSHRWTDAHAHITGDQYKAAAARPVAVVRARNARPLLSLRGKSGKSPNDVQTPRKTITTRITPPEDAPRSSSDCVDERNRDSSEIDRSIRPCSASSSPFHVDTTRYHVSLCMCEPCRRARSRRTPGPPPPPTFKMVGSEPRLVSATLQAHGFKKQGRRRAARGAWRVLWSSQHLRYHTFRNLNHGQRVNSFPRTYECTRKDALARNLDRMSQIHGEKHFGFAPRAFVLPAEREAVREAMAGSDGAWIVKPASSACGRGIFITKNFADLPGGARLEGNWIAQRYVEDPLLMDGLKFDLRLYVAITSFCPLRVYLHEEGLCRLATEPYSSQVRSFGNRFVHLTNYSVNRRSSRYEPGTTTGIDIDGKRTDCKDACLEGSASPVVKGTAVVETPLSAPSPRRAAATATNLAAEALKSAGTADVTSSVHQTAPSAENHAAIRFDIHDPVHGNVNREGDVAGGCVYPRRDRGRNEFRQDEEAETSKTKGCEGGFTSSMPLDGVNMGGRGSKWSLTALRKRLAGMGVNVPALWEKIHDLVIKTLVAIEAQMFGFDVLVDRKLKPHLLEVNFAPSLNTDNDLDLSVKSRVVADLLTLAGIRGAPGPKNSRAQLGRRRGRQGERNGDRSIGAAGSGGEAHDGERVGTRQTERGRFVKNTAAAGAIIAETEGIETPLEGVDAPAYKVASDNDGYACVEPVTKGERRNEVGSAGRRRHSRRARGKGAGVSGESGGCGRIAPAWDGCCGGGDSGLPSAEEVSAVAAESARELRRSGGFRLIFPVRETAHKYFKFFDGPRPLERMLATTRDEGPSQSQDTPKGFSRIGRISRRDRDGLRGRESRGDGQIIGSSNQEIRRAHGQITLVASTARKCCTAP